MSRPPTPDDLPARLFEEPHAFDFFRAAYLLERALGRPGQEARRPAVRYRPSATRAFPGADLYDAQRDRQGATLLVTFMGLYGPNASVPGALHGHLDDADERTHALRDFLDLFNHRLIDYAYRAWRKVRPELARGPEAEAARARLAAAAGLLDALLTGPDALPPDLIGFAGRLSSPARNPDGLQALLAHRTGANVTVEEHVPRWVPLPTRSRMGDLRLGSGAPIGARVRDCTSTFRVVLGPLDLDGYHALLPGGPLAREVARTVALYAPDTLAYEVELRLGTAYAPPGRLGRSAGRLGATAFLGTPRGHTHDRVVAYS